MEKNKNQMSIHTVVLSLEAHSLAQKYSKQHQRPEKAKQVYLNTLAVYGVNFYFQVLGVETDYDKSNSSNLLTQRFIDVADLYVKDLGKFECRPVLPNAKVLEVPPEAWDDRIGYIAVQLDQSLREAKLIGFTPKVVDKKGIIPLNELHSLEEFPEYLSQKRQQSTQVVAQQASPQFVNLERWLERASNAFQYGWQAIEEGFGYQRVGIAGALRGGQLEMLDLKDVKRWIAQVYASQPNAKQSQGNSLAELDVSSALIQLIELTQDAEIQWQAADFLWQINPNYLGAGNRGVKDLGIQLAGYPVTLIVAILALPNGRRAVRLQVSMSDRSYLPFGLKLIVLDEAGNLIQEVSARSKDDYIQFKFTASPGDRFSAKIALADASIAEFFAV